MKELRLRGLDSHKTWELFEREVEILRQLKHPSVPCALDWFSVVDGKYIALYLVREYVEGATLEEEMARGPTRADEARRVAIELLTTLADLHALSPPVIHRDMTPSNVVRRHDGRLMIIDFGAVKDVLQPDGSTIAGTFGFMAPEQLRGKALPQSDVYGVGALLLSLLAGKPAAELLDGRYRLHPGQVASGSLRVALKAMLDIHPHRRPTARAMAHRLAHPGRWHGRRFAQVAVAMLACGGMLQFASTVEPEPSAAEAHSAPALPEPPGPVLAEPQLDPQRRGSKGFVSTAPVAPTRRRFDPAPIPLPAPRPLQLERVAYNGPEPACVTNNSCADLGRGFFGASLNACEPLVRGRNVPRRSRAAEATAMRIGRWALRCQPDQQNGNYCNVHCTVTNATTEESREQLIQFVLDRYGPYVRETRDHRANSWTGETWVKRSFWWESEPSSHSAPELLVLFDNQRTVVSYRGRFR